MNNGYHFPYEKLTEWGDIIQAVGISIGIGVTIYVLASLIYWAISEVPVLRTEPYKRPEPRVWHSRTNTTTTTTYQSPDVLSEIAKVEAQQKRDYETAKNKRKRNHKRVRQLVAPKSDKDLT
jgi:hypothetical protein